MDIKITGENQRFKVRVAGMIIHNNKLLVCRIMNNPFLCLPGGHCHLFETSHDAIMREIKEETGLNVKIVELSGFYWKSVCFRKRGKLSRTLLYLQTHTIKPAKR